jgi:peptide-methionine (S)-S-oxide reductase
MKTRLTLLLAAMLTAALPGFAATAAPAATAHAPFAGGCCWCMVHPFDQLPAEISVTSGYTGGSKNKPTY